MIYTMMQACEKTGMTYQGLKFYCNEGSNLTAKSVWP